MCLRENYCIVEINNSVVGDFSANFRAFKRDIYNCAKGQYIEKIFYLDALSLLRREHVAAINGLILYAGTPNVPPRCVRERKRDSISHTRPLRHVR